jgi:hypothetical protein
LDGIWLTASETHLGARLGDSTEVVDHVGLGHTDTGIADGEDLVLLVGNDADDEVLLGVEDGGVGERGITDLVEGIGTVRDQLSEEDLLVGVEGVFDDGSVGGPWMREKNHILMIRSRSWLISAWKPKLSA